MVFPHRASADAEALRPFRYMDGIFEMFTPGDARSAIGGGLDGLAKPGLLAT
jgi:hypothetical protein